MHTYSMAYTVRIGIVITTGMLRTRLVFYNIGLIIKTLV